jgi:epoxyqueuosine reductase QueG
MLPRDLLAGARSVVAYFLPFAPQVVQANARDREHVAEAWVVAYLETNALIGRISARLIGLLAQRGINAAAEPAAYNCDESTLVSHWSHKSVAVIAGLGSFGLHQMVITDVGCAGRFGSLVMDAELPVSGRQPIERCSYFHDASCLECVLRCPVGALDSDEGLEKPVCWSHLRTMARAFAQVGRADVCGKCAVGPCSLGSAVLQAGRKALGRTSIALGSIWPEGIKTSADATLSREKVVTEGRLWQTLPSTMATESILSTFLQVRSWARQSSPQNCHWNNRAPAELPA